MSQNRKKLRQRLKHRWKALQAHRQRWGHGLWGQSMIPGSCAPKGPQQHPRTYHEYLQAYRRERAWALFEPRGGEQDEYPATVDCAACSGQRDSIMVDKNTCLACYEDGGPRAGDDPFGRSDEDWARHAE